MRQLKSPRKISMLSLKEKSVGLNLAEIQKLWDGVPPL